MHARVTYIDGEPDKVDDVIGQVESDVLPTLKGQDGFKGFTLLVDRSSGRLVGISFWESADAESASEEAIRQSRDEAAQTAGGGEPQVHRFEVAIDTMA